MKTKRRANKPFVGFVTTFIVCAILSVVLFVLTFTTKATEWLKLGHAEFQAPFTELFKGINGIQKGSVLNSFFQFGVFGTVGIKDIPVAFYVGYVVLILTIVIVIAQITYYAKKKRGAQIAWIILTFIMGAYLFEVCLLSATYIGTAPSAFFAYAGVFKPFLTFNAKALPALSKAHVIIYGVMLYAFILTVLLATIGAIGTYVTFFTKINAKNKEEITALNEQGSFNPDELQASEFEENVNNLNTIGTTSPLVVQYINSYGDQTKKQEPKEEPKQEQPTSGLTKEDLKEVIRDLIAELKPAEEPVVEEPVVAPVPVCEPAPVVEEPEVCPCCEEECCCDDEDIETCLVDEEGNEVEAIDADDLKEMIRQTVLETLEEAKPEVEETPVLEDAIVNDATITAACDDVSATADVETEVKSEEPVTQSTIVVALPADYKDDVVAEEVKTEDTVTDIDEVKDIIADEIRSALKDLAVAKPAPTKVIKKVVKVVEPKPEPKPVPVVKAEPVVEEPVVAPVAPVFRNETRGSEEAIEKGEVIRLNFLEKVASGSKDLVKNYNALKNLLMSFGLKDRLSNTADTFRLHKNTFAKITTNGDSIKLYLALDPKEYMSTALPIQDVSNKSAYKEIPLAIKVKSELSLKRATELIYACMRQAEIEQVADYATDVDYVSKVRKELKKIENSKR